MAANARRNGAPRMAIGPLSVGILSDAFAGTYGENNLRYAMAVTLTISLVGVFFLWMGARSLKRDLEVNALALERQKMV